MRSVAFGFILFLLAAGVLPAGSAWAFADHLFVVTSNGINAGSCASLELSPPWPSSVNLEPTSVRPSVRHFAGFHYVTNGAPVHDLQIIDPETFETVRRIPFAGAPNPRDVLVLEDETAYVSFFDSADLLRVDLATGAIVATIDLSLFSDPDGRPEMSHMIRDGNHAFVQLQKIDFSKVIGPQESGLLAVVDINTNKLIDVDPAEPGTQAIELAWSIPEFSMQIEGRLLYLSERGGFHDQSGGIEAVNLDTLEPMGLVYTEKEMGAAQMGGFLFVSATRGYFLHHTDFAQSSHLVSFSRETGMFLEEHFVSFGLTEEVAFDAKTGFLFFPDNESGVDGIRVFDAATGDQLTSTPISTGLPPVGVVVARDLGGSGAPAPSLGALQAWAIPNPSPGPISIQWQAELAGEFTLSIHDAAGRLVRGWDRVLAGTRASIFWDTRDESDRVVAPGVYFFRLTSGSNAASGLFAIVR
jgi:hypothetical protein